MINRSAAALVRLTQALGSAMVDVLQGGQGFRLRQGRHLHSLQSFDVSLTILVLCDFLFAGSGAEGNVPRACKAPVDNTRSEGLVCLHVYG